MNSEHIDDRIKLIAEAGEKIGKEVYFFAQNRNVLFRLNILDFHIEPVDSVPIRDGYCTEMFRVIRNWNEWLILVPSYAENVWAYNRKTGEWREIKIKRSEIPLKFIDAVVIEDMIYLIALLYPACVRISLPTFTVEYFWGDIDSDVSMQLSNCIVKNYCIYTASKLRNELYKYDLNNNDIKVFQIGSNTNQYGAIGWDGESFWLAPGRGGNIVNYRESNQEIEEYKIPEEIRSDYIFVGVVFDNDRVLFMPHKSGKGASMEHSDLKLVEHSDAVIFCETYADGTVVVMERDATIRIRQDGQWKIGKCEIDRRQLNEFFSENNCWDRIFTSAFTEESHDRNLADFLSYIAEG